MEKFVTYLNLFRYWQWLKNIILFIPLLLTDITNTKLLIEHLGLFILFSFFVSSTYILNDINDYEDDRKHPQKNKRPIASGEVSINESIFLFVFIFLATIYFTYYFYSIDLIKLFLFYFILTSLYSYKLKYINFLDGFVVSILYINRLFLGSELSEITLTYQLTLYIFFLSMFIFYLKKNSILNIGNYTNKLKEKISLQNFKIEIFLVINILLIILNSVLAWWMFGYIDSSTDYLFGFLFFILHIVILRDLISLSNQGLLEDISRTIFQIKNLKIKIFFVFTLFVLFYYL